jgi:hypothetical protein
MRKLLLALLLFQAVDAFAQTVGAEIASGPLPFTNVQSFLPAPAVALARDRAGVAIAWVMRGTAGDRISVVRLDATGHFTGAVQTIPASADSLDVLAPSIAAAPRGEGFTLAWLETSAGIPSVTRAAYCRLDRDLKPSTPAVLLVVSQPVTAPAIVRSGKTTWISAGTSAWELRDDGSLGSPLNTGFNATDMTVASDFPQVVAFGQVITGGPICPPGCGSTGHFARCSCPLAPITSNALLFTSLYSISTSRTLDFASDAAPAIGNDGHDVALVWLQGAHVRGGQVVMARLLPPSFTDFPKSVDQYSVIGTFSAEGGPTRPDIASDGARYVVVWRTAMSDGSHDIVGASIDRTGNIIPLSIATSTADERDPSVISMGDGTFLVAYEKLSNGQRRIAGRFVTFDPRGRAVR